MKEDKKRKCFLRQIARKRPRAARISSSGVMQQVSQSTTDDEAVAAVDASVPLKSSSFKGPFIPTSVLCIHSYLESKDSKEWNCGACTLLNPISRRRCQACGSRASFMSCEPLDNPLPRTVYSTPGKDNPLQAETSIAIRLVQKLHTPKTRKIDDCLPKLSGKSSPRLAKELDVNGRSCVSSTLAETNKIERSERNENESKRVLIRERLSSTDPMGNKPSDRGKCPNAIKNARSVPTPQNQETPILAKENYHQLQVTLARVLDELDNMYKFIQTQKEDTRSLREQNGDIMLAQKQLLNANRKMKASLAILETGMNVRHSEPEVASISNDTPSNVSPEVRLADNANVLTRGVYFCVSLIAVLLYYNCRCCDSLGRY